MNRKKFAVSFYLSLSACGRDAVKNYLYRSRLGLGETHFLHCFALIQRVQPHVRRTAAKMISVMFFFSLLLLLSVVFYSFDDFSCEFRDPTLFKNNLYPNGRLQQTMLIRCSSHFFYLLHTVKNVPRRTERSSHS